MKKIMIDGKEYWQQEECDIPKIPMPISLDILKYNQPERLNPEEVYIPLNNYEGNEDQWKKCWLDVCDSPNTANK